MTTFPLPTLGPTITANGITIPSLADIIASEQQSYRNIYGQDVDLSDDTKDGELIVIRSQAIFDCDTAIAAVYNGFSPTNAQGVNLSSLVKINGLRRQVPTFSTAPVTLIGQAGTPIVSGILADTFGNQWTLPPNLVIPTGGSLTSTLTCSTPGAVQLINGSTTIGASPTLTFVTVVAGWQSATTTANAIAGAPTESDAQLRQRQSVSTGLPAQTPVEAVLANVANSAGVTGYAIYENDTGSTNSLGIPGHSICVVVAGGNVSLIAQAIAEKKTPGTGTFATGLNAQSVIVVDPSGVPNTINFYELAQIPLYFVLGIHPLAGYLSTTGTLAVAAVAQALNSLVIGETAYVNKLFAAANLSGDAALAAGGGSTQQQLDLLSSTYNVTSIFLGTAPNPSSQVDVPINFNQQALCTPANGSITLT